MKSLIRNIKKKEENFIMRGKRTNPDDYIGKKFGVLRIIDVVEPNTNVRLSKVKVKCDCGRESTKVLNNVLHSPARCSKECKIFADAQNHKMVDKYINKKYNHLTIQSYVGKIEPSYSGYGGAKLYIVRCKCDCGRMIDVRLHNVIHGIKTTCGQCRLSIVQHGASINKDNDIVVSRLYGIYNHMANRARTSTEFLSKEWFNDDDPVSVIHNFMNYCRPLYEKVTNDGNPKHIFIHRIDINKPLGPGNIYFDHHIFNINYPGRVYY